jgi:hypothetical protein
VGLERKEAKPFWAGGYGKINTGGEGLRGKYIKRGGEVTKKRRCGYAN